MCKLCSTKWHWEVLCESTLYKVVLGMILCKLCNTKQWWEVLCTFFVVRSSTGKYFVEAVKYKVLLAGTLCKFLTGKYVV